MSAVVLHSVHACFTHHVHMSDNIAMQYCILTLVFCSNTHIIHCCILDVFLNV